MACGCGGSLIGRNPWAGIEKPVALEIPQAHLGVFEGPFGSIATAFTGKPVLLTADRPFSYYAQTVSVALVGEVEGLRYPRLALGHLDVEGHGQEMVERLYGTFLLGSTDLGYPEPQFCKAYIVAYDDLGKAYTASRRGGVAGLVSRYFEKNGFAVTFCQSAISGPQGFPTLAMDLVTGKPLAPDSVIANVPVLTPTDKTAAQQYRQIQGEKGLRSGGLYPSEPLESLAHPGAKEVEVLLNKYRGTTQGLEAYVGRHARQFAPSVTP